MEVRMEDGSVEVKPARARADGDAGVAHEELERKTNKLENLANK